MILTSADLVQSEKTRKALHKKEKFTGTLICKVH